MPKVLDSRALSLQWLIVLTVLTAGTLSCATNQKKPLGKEETARLYLDVANASLQENDPTGALEAFIRAEQDAPELPELHHGKALALAMKHNLPEAIKEARRAIQLSPNYSAAKNTLGSFLIEEGKFDEAVPFLTDAAQDMLNREAYKAYSNLGIVYYRRQDYAQADRNFEKATQAAPELSCIAYYYRGHIQLKDSHFTEALRFYDQATRKYCGSFADAHVAMGIAYERTRQYDLARRKFLEVEQRYPRTAAADKAVAELRNIP